MTLDQMIASVRTSIDTRLTERNAHTEAIAAIRDTLPDESAELSADQARQVQEHHTARAALDAQIEELRGRESQLEREIAADAAATALQAEVHPVGAGAARSQVGAEPNPIYRRDRSDTSYFRDLYGVARGERGAADRLTQSQVRAGTTGAGLGGEFAPPAWLVEDFVAAARAGRVTADLMQSETLPGGVSSINLPKILNGATVAVTQTQNSTITETTVTTTSVSSGITTISGKQTVSIELIRQSAIPFDRVILTDLAAAYAMYLDQQVLYGSNANGQLNGLATAATVVTYTTTTAVLTATTGTTLYNQVLTAKSKIEGSTFRPATAIVMHPGSWNWILSGTDLQARPLVTPSPIPSINGIGESSNGFTGHSFAGLPVYIDANVKTTTTGYIHVLRTDELWLFESAVETASFDATLADQNSILFRVLGFAAFIPNRLNYASAVVSGTGVAAAVL